MTLCTFCKYTWLKFTLVIKKIMKITFVLCLVSIMLYKRGLSSNRRLWLHTQEKSSRCFQHSVEKRRVHFKGLKTGGASSEIPRSTCLENNKAVASCSIHLWYCPRLHMLKIKVHPHIIGSICLCSRFAQTHNIGGVGSLTKPIQTSLWSSWISEMFFYYYYF